MKALSRAEPVPGVYPRGTLDAVAELLDSLSAAGISYCAWKSNEHLEAALAGGTDLDLLVDPLDAADLTRALGGHDVKRLQPPRDMCHPATEHYLGFDRSSGELFHLHVQYELVLGQKFIKNYTLPIERQFLETAELLHGVPVPPPELELAILATRALLKYRVRDVVKDVLRIRSPGVPAETRAEIDWLESRTTIERVRLASEASGVLPPDPICTFLEQLRSAPRSGWSTFGLQVRLRRALRGFRRRRAGAALFAYGRAAWRRRQRFVFRQPDSRLMPQTGGATIALVGSDGSGKSTTARALEQWLGWKLQTGVRYLGSKEPSVRSRSLYVGFRMLRRTHRATTDRLGPQSLPARPVAEARDAVHALHHLSIGRDRARRYQRALADARSGQVVIFDRFPLARLSDRDDDRLFDGPQIANAGRPTVGRVARGLAPLEERLYEQFRLPQQLIVLIVDPDIAAVRKPDHEPEVLRTKCRTILGLAARAEACPDVDVSRVDANRPTTTVLGEVKSEVWRAL